MEGVTLYFNVIHIYIYTHIDTHTHTQVLYVSAINLDL